MAAVSSKSYEKFCSFCFHSKRPESEFSNHWVKDKKDGTVCCPLLLAHECGYCHKKGHTPKHCPRLASREERRKAHAQRFASRAFGISAAEASALWRERAAMLDALCGAAQQQPRVLVGARAQRDRLAQLDHRQRVVAVRRERHPAHVVQCR